MRKSALLLFILLLGSCNKNITVEGVTFTREFVKKNSNSHVLTSVTVDNPDLLKKSIAMLGLEKCYLITFEDHNGVIYADLTKSDEGFSYHKYEAPSTGSIYVDSEIIYDGTKCAIISEDFVKSKLKFPLESKIRTSAHVHEVEGTQAIIMNKFSTKNAFGVTSEYVYKIWMNFNGGDWEDVENWSYTEMIIENTSTGEKEYF